MTRYLVALLALLAASPCFADVTVQVVAYNASSGEFNLAIAGDSADVRLDVGGGQLDWCKPGGENGSVATPTTPDLGLVNNQGALSTFVTLRGPVVTICDIDPNISWPGLKATVSGVQKDLPVGTVVTFSSASPQPPIVQPTPPVPTGSALLSWVPPTQNDNGTALTDLKGFKVYWGSAPGAYSSSKDVGNVTSYLVEQLAPGVWYFTVTALTSSAESAFSNVVSKTIKAEEPPKPVDPCVSDPLLAPTNLSWPTARDGRRSIGWNSPRSIVRVDYSWPLAGKQSATFRDDRGCSVTVAR